MRVIVQQVDAAVERIEKSKNRLLLFLSHTSFIGADLLDYCKQCRSLLFLVERNPTKANVAEPVARHKIQYALVIVANNLLSHVVHPDCKRQRPIVEQLLDRHIIAHAERLETTAETLIAHEETEFRAVKFDDGDRHSIERLNIDLVEVDRLHRRLRQQVDPTDRIVISTRGFILGLPRHVLLIVDQRRFAVIKSLRLLAIDLVQELDDFFIFDVDHQGAQAHLLDHVHHIFEQDSSISIGVEVAQEVAVDFEQIGSKRPKDIERRLIARKMIDPYLQAHVAQSLERIDYERLMSSANRRLSYLDVERAARKIIFVESA